MSNRPTPSKQPSPADLIAACEADIARLEGKHEQLAQRVAEHASARERLSYRAHVQQDAEASKELAEAREAALRAEQELTEVESALVTARGNLAEAEQAQAREQRRARIKEQQKLSKEYRELGPFLDKATDNLRRGLLALQQNAASVGGRSTAGRDRLRSDSEGNGNDQVVMSRPGFYSAILASG